MTDHIHKALSKFIQDNPQLIPPEYIVFGNLRSVQLFNAKGVKAIQPYYTPAQSLISAGVEVIDVIPDNSTSCILFAQRCREENLGYIGQAAIQMAEGGELIFVCSNELGPKSIEKRIKQIFGEIEVFSKHKVRITKAVKTRQFNHDICKDFVNYNYSKSVEDSNLCSYAGNFSWKKIDRASELLAEFLPEKLSGIGADFGAGYGFLSHYILSKHVIDKIYLLEHDQRALSAAKTNCTQWENQCKYLWCDVKRIDLDQHFDWIVMNPPFHVGNKTRPDLGQAFFKKALEHLAPGGTLYAVANKSLPYESILKSNNCQFDINETKGFKLIRCQLS